MNNKVISKIISGTLLCSMVGYTLPVFAYTKDETVYSKMDSNGKNYKTIVSTHIKNTENADLINDLSDLLNVKNTSGDETYTQDGNKFVWNANKNDIYYQGESSKELPIECNVKYELDGKELSANEIAGKSGKVKITLQYTNKEERTVDINGKKVKEVELKNEVFGIEPNEAVVHSVLVNFLANQRQGTQSTKTRSEVSGGGKKPWRQKGTGRARQGSIRAPQWIKGGIALGPKTRSYKYTVNKKERQLAIKSLLSSKVLENNLVVVDSLPLKDIKTKEMVKALSNLKVEGKALIMLPEKNENVQKSARNIEGVKTTLVGTINVYDLLKYNKLVLTLDTVKKLEEVYA